MQTCTTTGGRGENHCQSLLKLKIWVKFWGKLEVGSNLCSSAQHSQNVWIQFNVNSILHLKIWDKVQSFTTGCNLSLNIDISHGSTVIQITFHRWHTNTAPYRLYKPRHCSFCKVWILSIKISPQMISVFSWHFYTHSGVRFHNGFEPSWNTIRCVRRSNWWTSKVWPFVHSGVNASNFGIVIGRTSSLLHPAYEHLSIPAFFLLNPLETFLFLVAYSIFPFALQILILNPALSPSFFEQSGNLAGSKTGSLPGIWLCGLEKDFWHMREQLG